jgi:hypothetical protein
MLTLLEMALFPEGLPLIEAVNHIRSAFDFSLISQALALKYARADGDTATAALLTADGVSHPSNPVGFAAAVLRPLLHLLAPAVLCMHPDSSSSGSSSGMGFGGRLGDAPQHEVEFQTGEAQKLFARLLLADVIAGAL